LENTVFGLKIGDGTAASKNRENREAILTFAAVQARQHTESMEQQAGAIEWAAVIWLNLGRMFVMAASTHLFVTAVSTHDTFGGGTYVCN
jgi:hypothetical protein